MVLQFPCCITRGPSLNGKKVYCTTIDHVWRECIFHTFWSWTQEWKIYIDIFYGVSCNINHIQLVLQPRVLRCINIELFLPVSLPRNTIPVPKSIAVHTFESWSQECDGTIGHTHNALKCDTRCHFWGVYWTTFDPVHRNVDFPKFPPW